MPTPEHLNADCNHVPRDEGSTLKYIAHYAAPGTGYAAECTVCLQQFAVVGASVYDPSEMQHVLGPDDVI